MKEKKHGQSVQCVQFENVPAVHSIADVCSMKEKNHAIGHDRIAT